MSLRKRKAQAQTSYSLEIYFMGTQMQKRTGNLPKTQKNISRYTGSCSLQTENTLTLLVHSQTDRVEGKVTGGLKSVRVAFGRFCTLFKLQIQLSLRIFFSESYRRLVQVTDALSQITSHFIFAGLLDLV